MGEFFIHQPYDENRRKGNIMNQTTKTILVIAGSLLLLCGCGVALLAGTGLWSFSRIVKFADESTTENPQEVAQIASEIADFDLPEGYDTQYGMEISTFSMVQYATRNEENYIFLTQFPAGTSINVDEMMREVRDGSRRPNSPWHNIDTELVEQMPVTIRGQETTLSINEGRNDQGELYRMANATFRGRGEGPALLMFIGPADQWNLDLVEDFLNSIQ
jgi:hypothetical protein